MGAEYTTVGCVECVPAWQGPTGPGHRHQALCFRMPAIFECCYFGKLESEAAIAVQTRKANKSGWGTRTRT